MHFQVSNPIEPMPKMCLINYNILRYCITAWHRHQGTLCLSLYEFPFPTIRWKEAQLIFHFNSHNLFTIISGTRVEIRVISSVCSGGGKRESPLNGLIELRWQFYLISFGQNGILLVAWRLSWWIHFLGTLATCHMQMSSGHWGRFPS